MSDDTSKHNFLISVCKCKGTLKYIHLECLKFWVKSKINVKFENSYMRVIEEKDVKCELCLQSFPLKFSYNNVDYDLLNLTQTYKNFIVFSCKDSLLLIFKLNEQTEYRIVIYFKKFNLNKITCKFF